MPPATFHLGHLAFPVFGVLAAVGLMSALALSQRTAALAFSGQAAGPRSFAESLWNAALVAVIGAFAISRVLLLASNFSVFLHYPILLLAVPSLTPGGLLLTLVLLFLWLRWKRIPLLDALDAWAPCVTLLWAFLALGHLAEGSDPGLPVHRGDLTGAHHPVAGYVCASALLLTCLAYAWLRRSRRPGETAGFAAVGAGAAQFFLSFLREPGLEMGGGLDALQCVALGLMLTGGVLLVFSEGGRRSLLPHPEDFSPAVTPGSYTDPASVAKPASGAE